MIGEALEACAGTHWRAADVPPELFWPDFLEIATMLANYGVLHRTVSHPERVAQARADATKRHNLFLVAKCGGSPDSPSSTAFCAQAGDGRGLVSGPQVGEALVRSARGGAW